MLTNKDAMEICDMIVELRRDPNSFRMERVCKKIESLVEKPKREVDGKNMILTHGAHLLEYKDHQGFPKIHRSFELEGEWIHFPAKGRNLDLSKSYKIVEIEDAD